MSGIGAKASQEGLLGATRGYWRLLGPIGKTWHCLGSSGLYFELDIDEKGHSIQNPKYLNTEYAPKPNMKHPSTENIFELRSILLLCQKDMDPISGLD